MQIGVGDNLHSIYDSFSKEDFEEFAKTIISKNHFSYSLINTDLTTKARTLCLKIKSVLDTNSVADIIAEGDIIYELLCSSIEQLYENEINTIESDLFDAAYRGGHDLYNNMTDDERYNVVGEEYEVDTEWGCVDVFIEVDGKASEGYYLNVRPNEEQIAAIANDAVITDCDDLFGEEVLEEHNPKNIAILALIHFYLAVKETTSPNDQWRLLFQTLELTSLSLRYNAETTIRKNMVVPANKARTENAKIERQRIREHYLRSDAKNIDDFITKYSNDVGAGISKIKLALKGVKK